MTVLLCASTVTCATTKTRVLRKCDWRKRVVFVVGKGKRRRFEMMVLWHGVGEEGEREERGGKEGVTEEGAGEEGEEEELAEKKGAEKKGAEEEELVVLAPPQRH